MELYIIYSGYSDCDVLRIETNRERAIAYAEEYTSDTKYNSYVAEVNHFVDWYDCDNWFNDPNIIYRTFEEE